MLRPRVQLIHANDSTSCDAPMPGEQAASCTVLTTGHRGTGKWAEVSTLYSATEMVLSVCNVKELYITLHLEKWSLKATMLARS